MYFTSVGSSFEAPKNISEDERKAFYIELYDGIADMTNESFGEFLHKAFFVPLVENSVIKAGREIVADRCLFVKKKKYAARIFDKEGTRVDKAPSKGQIKVMGLEIKRSDTPKFIQEFLSNTLELFLDGFGKNDIIDYIKAFKEELRRMPAWEKGNPRGVNSLTDYTRKINSSFTGMIPGHVRAAYNYNMLRKAYEDNQVSEITDGQKVIVCYLRQNPLGLGAIAYPTDEKHLPEWFKSLPFDTEEMEKALVDKKIDNLLGVMNWDLKSEINCEFDLF
jgi:hypothetical protein